MTVAALFVEPRGVYSTMPGVEPWGLPDRDALDYAGPHPIVAHPPCQRWCAMAGHAHIVHGAPAPGDDGGVFEASITLLRRWRGVLEHPAKSKAWSAYGLPSPSLGGWQRGMDGSWATEVYQGAYGHRAPKATWLLYVGSAPPPQLDWRPIDPGHRVEVMGRPERRRTPEAFARLLVGIALGAVDD